MGVLKLTPRAHGLQFVVAAERIDQRAEAEEQTCVAQRNANWIDKNHDDAECVRVEEARRLAVEGEVGVMQHRIVRLQLEARRKQSEVNGEQRGGREWRRRTTEEQRGVVKKKKRTETEESGDVGDDEQEKE